VIDRLERALRQARRALSRSEWTAVLLGLPPSRGTGSSPGLVIVQIDGLPRRTLTEALASGHMPFLRHLLVDEGYEIRPLYSGVPSSTPAVQAELFFGVPQAVPAFSFVDRCDGRLVRMWQHETADAVESGLSRHRSLLAGGGSYCNIYAAGAAEARFCMSSLGWTDAFRTRHVVALPVIVALYLPEVVRAALLVIRELLMAPGGLVAALARGEHAASELKFISSRAVIAVTLRELSALSAEIDIARGLPVVYLNLLGYDEYAHRRGPTSALARHSLGDIDAVIGRLVRASRRSQRRAYDAWVLSDHGQERTLSYVEERGQSVKEAVAGVFREHGFEPRDAAPPELPLGKRLLARLLPGLDFLVEHWEPGAVVVTAQGPLGHVYAPRPLAGQQRDAIARDLVRQAGIPLVLAAEPTGEARAWTRTGSYLLPAEAATVLGADHPYLHPVARDLVDLCRHPDAGDLVISGWQLGEPPLSFPHEHGSHAGPGPSETDAFLFTPPDAPVPRSEPLRPADVRAAAFTVLDRVMRRPAPVRSGPVSAPNSAATVRLLTYNVHSCIGVDGKLSPERIARVIARHDPDIVALQELDVGRARTGGVDQAELIAKHLEMLLHFHPTLSVEEERYGDAVLSRLPMRVVRAGELPRRPPLEPRGALWVEIGDGDGAAFQVINTHLSLHPAERQLQVDALLGPEWLGAALPRGGAVLCGDFNALSWFPTCRQITRRLRDVQVREGHRPRNTWGGRVPLWRIDHVFVDPVIEVRHVEVPDDALARVASDHLPLVVDLQR
jgi:endonuclease/exonuclease/phosphatase family metal-dependent hydrolase